MALPKIKGKAETILEIALALALLRPDWKSLLPNNLTNSHVGIQNSTDPYLTAKQTSADAYNPLNEFTSWESLGEKIHFSNDLIAMLNTVLEENSGVESCDESGYSSENPSSPSASSCTGSISYDTPSHYLGNGPLEDASCLGATGYTPPREEKESVWDLEDFVDLSSIETPPVDKQPWNWPANLQVDLHNNYDDDFSVTKGFVEKGTPMLTNASGSDFFDDGKLSLDDDILLQTPLDFHSQDSYDPYSIDFALKGESLENPEPDVDYDTVASYLGELDLPLDILDTSAATDLTSGNGTNVPPTGSMLNGTLEEQSAISHVLTIKKETEREESVQKEIDSEAPSEEVKKRKRQNRNQPTQLDLTEDEIVDLPVAKFNDYLATITDSQAAALAKDIRRRGKNKEAARVCRKRKMDTISQLEEEIALIASRKDLLLKENKLLDDENADLKQQIGGLYNYVFASLRDENGQPLSPSEHSLLHAANGCLYLVPNSNNSKKSLKVKNEILQCQNMSYERPVPCF